MTLVGAMWSADAALALRRSGADLYWEASVGRWRGKNAVGDQRFAWTTQIGITPVLRWHPRAWKGPWFVEAGIGVNWLLPVYRSRDREFSTSFNFGEHLGVGREFGVDQAHELLLRLQHFSNGGLKKPNPGIEFLQLRYVWRH